MMKLMRLVVKQTLPALLLLVGGLAVLPILTYAATKIPLVLNGAQIQQLQSADTILTSGSPCLVVSSPTTVSQTVPFNAQTGTSYTVLTGDNCKVVTFSNTSAVAVTLPQAGSAGFASGFAATFVNLNTGVVTITTTTSTINGTGQTVVLAKGMAISLASDGTNWEGAFGPAPNGYTDGQLLIGSTASGGLKPGTLTAGANITITNAANAITIASSGGGGGTLVNNTIAGCVLSNDGTTPNTVLDVAVCQATDSTNAEYIPTLAASFTKSISGSFATGSGSNGMGVGLTATASTWYHVFEIDCSTGGAHGDIYFDTSLTAANIPACATKYRRLGSILLNGSTQITAFLQTNDTFLWNVVQSDIVNQTYTTTGSNVALSIPPGVRVMVNLGVYVGATANLSVYDPDLSGTTSGANQFCPFGTTTGVCQVQAMSNTSQQLHFSGNTLSATMVYEATLGWRDFRGQ